VFMALVGHKTKKGDHTQRIRYAETAGGDAFVLAALVCAVAQGMRSPCKGRCGRGLQCLCQIESTNPVPAPVGHANQALLALRACAEAARVGWPRPCLLLVHGWHPQSLPPKPNVPATSAS